MDAEAPQVEADGGEDVGVGFAGVAPPGRDLPELEGAAEEGAPRFVQWAASQQTSPDRTIKSSRPFTARRWSCVKEMAPWGQALSHSG